MAPVRIISSLTIGLGAVLLFSVELIAAKDLLPLLGGSSAVWLACLCFFQIALLVGYLYARLLTRLPGRVAALLHVGALALATGWTALVFARAPKALQSLQHPGAALFLLLSARIGLPFVLLSATSPLLQTWLAKLQVGAVRYRLFALSNVGSLLALILYPLVVEPYVALHRQREVWVWSFALYALLCGWLAAQVRLLPTDPSGPPHAGLTDAPSPTAARPVKVWRCFLLAAAGSLQLCAITSHLTENLAALPLLWVLPLGVYLLTFILAFERPRLYAQEPVMRLLVVLLASLGYLLSKVDVSLPVGVGVCIFLAELFFSCWFLHAELFGLRPGQVQDAPTFYLVLAAGGAAGTLMATVLAPLLFDANYDLPLAFAVTAAAAFALTWDGGWAKRLLWSTSTVLCLVLAARLHTAYQRGALLMARSFYGTLRVKQGDLPVQSGGSRLLLHGTIEHGMQWFAPEFRRQATTYYGPESGIGVAVSDGCTPGPRRFGVIGLGAGTIATYGRPGDTMRFYEINPLVEQVARELFTYLRESPATVTVIEGDARLSLAREEPQRFDVLAVDAFSGDAIPVHLLTVEAMRLYQRHLAPGGIVAFHISNQYLDLAPVLRALGTELHLRTEVINSPAEPQKGIFAAKWMIVGDPAALFFSRRPVPISEAPGVPATRPWTDDFSSLLPTVRWSGSSR